MAWTQISPAIVSLHHRCTSPECQLPVASPKPQCVLCRLCCCGAHLQLGPLNPAHAAGCIPPGMLCTIDQLCVPQLVGVGGFNLLGHLLQPLHVGLGARSVWAGSGGDGIHQPGWSAESCCSPLGSMYMHTCVPSDSRWPDANGRGQSFVWKHTVIATNATP